MLSEHIRRISER